MRLRTVLLALIVVLNILVGCTVNSITQERQFSLLSQEDEIALGNREFSPAQQVGGGLYRADPGLAEYVTSVGRRVTAASDRTLP